LILLAPTLLVSGCGGFAASKSVSPATFLLPGLFSVDPRPPSRDPSEGFKNAPVVVRFSNDPVR